MPEAIRAEQTPRPDENPVPTPPPSGTPAVDVAELERRVIQAIKTCFDPEIPVNIYELGLIYSIEVDPSGDVRIKMTLTTPACPVAGSLPIEVEDKIRALDGVRSVAVELVWDPMWHPDMMSEAAKLNLGFL